MTRRHGADESLSGRRLARLRRLAGTPSAPQERIFLFIIICVVWIFLGRPEAEILFHDPEQRVIRQTLVQSEGNESVLRKT